MNKQKKGVKAAKTEQVKSFVFFPFLKVWHAYLALAIIGFAFYINTINNEFALDDGIVIHKNEFVIKGSKGINGILKHDAYWSFYRQMNAEDQLSGGRYRPLSIVSFALEQNIIGTTKDGKYNNLIFDTNKNGKPDPEEDVNDDGLYNENDFLVKGCKLRHFNNMLFFIISVLLLFHFLKNFLFQKNVDLAFLASLLFCIHPIHTEVVANMKSRDEIFSLIFILLTFIFSFRYMESKKVKHAVLAGGMYLLALLSKEYAFTLLILIPMALYIFTVNKVDFKDRKFWLVGIGLIVFVVFISYLKYLTEAAPKDHKSLLKNLNTIYYVVIFAYAGLALFITRKEFKGGKMSALFASLGIGFIIYVCMRWNAVVITSKVANNEILNNPYLHATAIETWATKIFVLLKYLLLLFVPYPLSSDYSFDTIKYRHFSDWDTLASLFIHVSLAVLAFVLLRKKHPLAFALMFYFANLAMVGNIFMDIGATMGERLIFHSSVGFSIAIAWLLTEGLSKFKIPVNNVRAANIGFALIVTFGCAYITIPRNAEWKNDITLFTKDVETVPNSVLCLGNAGARWIDLSERPENKSKEKEYLMKSVGYLKHALELHPKYVNGYLNLGLAYFKLNDFDKAEDTWSEAKKLYPNNPFLLRYYQYLAAKYIDIGINTGQKGDLETAMKKLKKATELAPDFDEAWYNYGGAAFTTKNYVLAKSCFERCLQLNPNHEQSKKAMASAEITSLPK